MTTLSTVFHYPYFYNLAFWIPTEVIHWLLLKTEIIHIFKQTDFTWKYNQRLVSCTFQQIPLKYISSLTLEKRNAPKNQSIRPEQPKGKVNQLRDAKTMNESTAIKTLMLRLLPLKLIRIRHRQFLKMQSQVLLEYL